MMSKECAKHAKWSLSNGKTEKQSRDAGQKVERAEQVSQCRFVCQAGQIIGIKSPSWILYGDG